MENVYVTMMRKELPQATFVGMTGEDLTIADFPDGLLIWLVDANTVSRPMLAGLNVACGFMGPHATSVLPRVLKPFVPEGADAVYTVLMNRDHQRLNK